MELEKNYSIELECYQRLKAANVVSLQGFAVPQLIASNDRLLIIEMRIVTAPYILDFAKSHLDARPDFSNETWEEWEQDCRERFGDRWSRVRSLLYALQKYGIYYYDAKPANISFADTGEE